MFGLGTGEILIILVLALILLGPQKLPEAAKSIGKGLRQISRATEDVKRQMQTAMYEEDRPRPAPPQATPPGAAAPPSASQVVAATAANVPGLEAALAEPVPQPALEPSPQPALRPETAPVPADGAPKA
jgi:sec-independent protein translocase protein TatB